MGFTTSSLADLSPDIFSHQYPETDVKISPEGNYLGIVLTKGNDRTLITLDTQSMENIGGVNFGRLQDVGNFFWSAEDRLIVEILHRTEWDHNRKFLGELYASDADGGHGEMIYGYRAGQKQVGSARKKRKSIYGWARLVSTLPNERNDILISSTELPYGSELMTNKQKRELIDVDQLREQYSTVHKLNVIDGKLGPVLARSPAPNSTFYEVNSTIQYAIGDGSSSQKTAFKFVDGDWTPISLAKDSNAKPIGFDKRMSTLYFQSAADQNGDVCFYTKNLATSEEALLECELDPSSVVYSSNNVTPLAARTSNTDAMMYFTESDNEVSILRSIEELFPSGKLSVTSLTTSGNYAVIKRENEAALEFYLLNAKDSQISRIL